MTDGSAMPEFREQKRPPNSIEVASTVLPSAAHAVPNDRAAALHLADGSGGFIAVMGGVEGGGAESGRVAESLQQDLFFSIRDNSGRLPNLRHVEDLLVNSVLDRAQIIRRQHEIEEISPEADTSLVAGHVFWSFKDDGLQLAALKIGDPDLYRYDVGQGRLVLLDDMSTDSQKPNTVGSVNNESDLTIHTYPINPGDIYLAVTAGVPGTFDPGFLEQVLQEEFQGANKSDPHGPDVMDSFVRGIAGRTRRTQTALAAEKVPPGDIAIAALRMRPH